MLTTLSILNILITPFEIQHIPLAKEIILHAVYEYQIEPFQSIEEAKALFEDNNCLPDLKNFEKYYNQNNGILLAMLDNNKLIGMGGILYYSPTICELRRMFFDKAYRGKGLGSLMLQTLLDHAKKLGYHYIRLEVYNRFTQKEALAFYKKFGFYTIDHYRKDLPQTALSMQKDLI